MKRTQSSTTTTRAALVLALVMMLTTAGSVAAGPPVYATLHGTADGDGFGFSVAGAGDFNADGRDDIVVGAPWADAFGIDSGAAYVYYGGAQPIAGPVLQGYGVSGTEIGYSVASAGRFNDDGVDDIVVCQRGGQSVASVYLGGSPPAGGVSFALLPTQPGAQMVDSGAWNTFCHAVARTDFNGDGMDDLIVGAPAYRGSGSTPSGRVYVYFGRPLTAQRETYADHVLDAGAYLESYDAFGTSLVGLDFDHDGYGDFAVGAPGSNAVFLYFGSASGVPGTPMVFSEVTGGYGNSLTVGDLNYDNRDDLVVGAADSLSNSTAESGVYRYFGGSTPDAIQDGFTRSTVDWTQYGWSVAVVDPEDEGYDNLLIGDPSWYLDSTGLAVNQGRVYDASQGYRFDGTTWGDRFGQSLANLGDVTGDGREDFAVGAPRWFDPGFVRLYRGFDATPPSCGNKCPNIGDGTQETKP